MEYNLLTEEKERNSCWERAIMGMIIVFIISCIGFFNSSINIDKKIEENYNNAAIYNKIVVDILDYYVVSYAWYKTAHENYIFQVNKIKEQELPTFVVPDKKDIVSSIKANVYAYTAAKDEGSGTGLTITDKPVKIGYIAASHDIVKKWKFGTKVYVEGIGIFEIQDQMSKRYKNSFDIYIPTKKQAFDFGVKRKIKVYKLK